MSPTTNYRFNLLAVFSALLAAALFSAQHDTGVAPSLDVVSAQTEQCKVTADFSPSLEHQKVTLERDPWVNPIVGCSLVSAGEFGYDQRDIYRLPAEPKAPWAGPKNGLRDPMRNLLI